MPFGDGTGPLGQGPGAGRGAGRGQRGGQGRGSGAGRGSGLGPCGRGTVQAPADLDQRIHWLEQMLDWLKQRRGQKTPKS